MISFNRLFEGALFSFDKGEGFEGFAFPARVFWMLDIADLVNWSEWLSSGLTISLYVLSTSITAEGSAAKSSYVMLEPFNSASHSGGIPFTLNVPFEAS